MGAQERHGLLDAGEAADLGVEVGTDIGRADEVEDVAAGVESGAMTVVGPPPF